MGRYVYFEKGNFNWEWQFGSAVQCSNFGEVLDMLENYSKKIYVNRYRGEQGEYVNLSANRQELLNALSKLLKELDSCPICNSKACFKYTVEMMKDFKESIEKTNIDRIETLWYVEYY